MAVAQGKYQNKQGHCTAPNCLGQTCYLNNWVRLAIKALGLNYFHFGLLSIQTLLYISIIVKYSTIGLLTYVLGSLKLSTFSVPISDVEILMAEKQILLF